MQIPPELLPVIQITLPIVAAIFGASWLQNKRIDDIRADMGSIRTDMKEGFAKIDHRLEAIEKILREHGERITRLEERIPPLVHR